MSITLIKSFIGYRTSFHWLHWLLQLIHFASNRCQRVWLGASDLEEEVRDQHLNKQDPEAGGCARGDMGDTGDAG